MEVIISHTNADFDSLAAMAAAKKIYPDAVLAFSGSADSGVREFLAIHGEWLSVLSPSEVNLKDITRLIVVDTREAFRLGDFREVVEKPGVEIHIYDHHPGSYRDIVGELNVVKPSGSTTTILVEMIRERGIPIHAREATLFLTGIYVDTGSLSFPSTTPEDMRASAWLLEQGASLRIVGDFLNRSLSDEQRRVLNMLMQSAKTVEVNGHRILIASASVDQYVDELAVLTHRLIDLERAPAAFSLARMGDRVYVVGRSITPSIDVSKVLAEMGGGGHPTAASASLKAVDLTSIENQLVKILRHQVLPSLTAGSVMHTPVWRIEPGKRMEQAREEMIRLGASSVLVMEGETVIGALSRRDVDKAVHHGFSNAPASAYMSRHLPAVSPSTPLAEVQRLMIAHEAGRLPVVDCGKVVGVVTRSDIVKSMTDQEFQKPVLASVLRIEDWSSVPRVVRGLLESAGEIAAAGSLNLFVVGGFVRDLLLGVPNFDLDLVVEGDGIAFARVLAEKMGGSMWTHEKFGTAAVFLPDGFKIDLATARREYYARPAALPEVVGTSIKQDLYRRDFSINGMAVKLNPPDFGQLIDFFGGQRDLQHGVIRVLHNLSFIDDPTRIFRAVRFEQRFHFRMESHTEKLLREALKSGAVGHLSMERVSEEIRLILSEPDPLAAIKRMGSLKIFPLLHPALKLPSEVARILEEIPQALAHFQSLLEGEAISTWVLYGIALFSSLAPNEAETLLAKLTWPAVDRGKFSFLFSDWKPAVHELSAGGSLPPSKIAKLLREVSLEGLVFLHAYTHHYRDRERIREYAAKWRKVTPLVSGEDLVALGLSPGPSFRGILDRVKNAQLDGVIRSKTEALEYLKNEVKKHGQTPPDERDEAHRKIAHRASPRRP